MEKHSSSDQRHISEMNPYLALSEKIFMQLRALCISFLVLTIATSCSGPGPAISTANVPTEYGAVRFNAGFETDPRDHGRPVILIATALGVSADVFRDAFSGVSPSRLGPPTPSRARANKKVLMDALEKHGVTNDRLDEVSDYYRYTPQSGELWTHTPAEASAVIQEGKITRFIITNPGAGYSTPPEVRVNGFEELQVRASIEFGTDLTTNGHVTALTIIEQ